MIVSPQPLPLDAATTMAEQALAAGHRLLLFGQPGTGKSSLAAVLAAHHQRSPCIGADPGSPPFGLPGCVTLARWAETDWQVLAREPICSLDGARFRLPLAGAVRRLALLVGSGPLILDGPGVIRGVAGAELLPALIEAASIDRVLAMTRGQGPPLYNELQAIRVRVDLARPAPGAARPGKQARARARTALWDAYLQDASETSLDLDALAVVGTPPPRDVPEAWSGRQLALSAGSQLVAMGEALALDGRRLRARLTDPGRDADTLLVRDAVRGADGLMGSARPFGQASVHYVPPPDVAPYPGGAHAAGPAPVARVGPLSAVMVNGVLGDPLLHLRLRHQRRSLLFDLGDTGRLSARIAHQVSDVFISHAHFDHIGGFLWLLRSRIGDLLPCRLFGPPGLAGHIAGLVSGVLWDRAGARAPAFQVAELHGGDLLWYWIQAGQGGPSYVTTATASGGVLWEEDAFRVRATTLDHGGTPVLAFAFEMPREVHIRKERLKARGLEPGPWLGQLKQQLLAEARQAPISLPDGTRETAGELAEDLALVAPGKTLVYATDLADTDDNRGRLQQLARHAHTLFCEAAFLQADAEQARRTGHLTARACGEIAVAGDVRYLVPFHFSRRYDGRLGAVYAEVESVCSRLIGPPGWTEPGP